MHRRDASPFADEQVHFGDSVRAEGDEGFVAGWASTHTRIDSFRTLLAKNAFRESIQTKGLGGPNGIKLLIGHDRNKVAGRITKLEQREKGLWMEAKLDLSISYARDAFLAAKANGGLSFSVGFRTKPSDMELAETPEGAEYIRINKAELREVSIVTEASNEEAVMEHLREEGTDSAAQGAVQAHQRAWRVGAARNLPIGADSAWNGPAARQRVLAAAGFDDGDPDPEMARRAFLVYDDEKPNLKGSYKLPFADIVGGRLRAMPAGLRAAASRLPQTDAPEAVLARAQSVLDGYFDRMERAAEELDLPQLQRMLVEEGWVKESRVDDLVTIIRAHVDLFKEEEPEPLTKPVSDTTVNNLRKAAEAIRRVTDN